MSVSTVTSLFALPNELLVQIFEGVPNDYSERCRTLAAIARVNRPFHAIITPTLYQSFQDCCVKHLQLFGRTILSHKGRAELVKHYTARRSPSACPSGWNVFALDGALEVALLKQLPTLPSPITPAVYSYALACILPNLQRLDMPNGGSVLMKQLSASCSPPNVSFRQLGNLHIATEPNRTYGMHDLALLFMLPSITTLTVDLAALNRTEEQRSAPIEAIWRCCSRSSTIQELNLERCGLPAPWISAMVTSCEVLKHFHHEHYYWDVDAAYYAHIFQALTIHQETLSYVRTNEINGCKVDAAHQSDPAEPLSFEHFRSLTHLDIPLFNFASRTQHCSVDRLLPPSLRVLTLDVRSAREGFSDNFFMSLADAAHRHLPRLKSIEVICRIEEYREDGYLPLHFCHLRRVFASYGIELSYFLEFVQCEFKAAYMGHLLANMRLSGPDGYEMADHSSLEVGCLGQSYPSRSCGSRSQNANRSKRNWGYMQDWTGPAEFELLT